jgi:hypothetical protein
MHRSTLLPFVLGPTLLGCTHASASPVAKTPDPPGLAIAYRVLDGEKVILSERSQGDPHNSVRVEATTAHGAARETFDVDAHPRDDGTVYVQMRYEETSDDGAKIDWRPAVRMAHGVTARAAVAGAAWGRRIEISVE